MPRFKFWMFGFLSLVGLAGCTVTPGPYGELIISPPDVQSFLPRQVQYYYQSPQLHVVTARAVFTGEIGGAPGRVTLTEFSDGRYFADMALTTLTLA